MKAVNSLPENYRQIYEVNLQKTPKMAFLLNGAALLIGVVLAVPVHFMVPVTTLLDMSRGFMPYLIRLLAIIVLMVVYIVLHELVHGIAMKMCGTKKVKYGFTGLYAYAGSEDYYGKGSYIFIALAPVVLWGVVLAVVNFFVPIEWFWVIYIVQIQNLSGAVGDLFVAFKFARMPRDILVKDVGVGMTVYSAQVEDSQNNE